MEALVCSDILSNVMLGYPAGSKVRSIAAAAAAAMRTAARAAMAAQSAKDITDEASRYRLDNSVHEAARLAYVAAEHESGTADRPLIASDSTENPLAIITAAHARADFDHALALASEERWSDDTPISTTAFGRLWRPDTAESLPVAGTARAWLLESIGGFRPKPSVTWSLALRENDGSPLGIWGTVAVGEWAIDYGRAFTWTQLLDENYFHGELLALWGLVLGDRQRGILRTTRPAEAK